MSYAYWLLIIVYAKWRDKYNHTNTALVLLAICTLFIGDSQYLYCLLLNTCYCIRITNFKYSKLNNYEYFLIYIYCIYIHVSMHIQCAAICTYTCVYTYCCWQCQLGFKRIPTTKCISITLLGCTWRGTQQWRISACACSHTSEYAIALTQRT